jgi:hypothetical protein
VPESKRDIHIVKPKLPTELHANRTRECLNLANVGVGMNELKPIAKASKAVNTPVKMTLVPKFG